jgi:hypothetical protein
MAGSNAVAHVDEPHLPHLPGLRPEERDPTVRISRYRTMIAELPAIPSDNTVRLG